ncbi:Cullin, N-terminal domain and Cullin repeat-like-containing domain-containing protein [Strongyloides ratti]|uniref:Cullin, N-terminal domain and Cullin repeat-like-containing domain-containing protein n=1 Tax=Strongyloides ratti TaxID=34506 RepID=A0A090LDD9_STRRB|nr:Cullin, N-terminal domain and Cullin repeat-like-containing domain-containing protein [Strongyloides ratti]CEF66148.1 Cullin, N-terminal domain and Cullin repeat-like-containing domain-containing protein [Strongyloides ratti]
MICLSVEEKSRLETKLRELLMEKSLCLNSCSPKKSMEIYNLVYSYCIKLRKCKKKAVRSLVEVNNSTLDKNEIIGREIFSILKNFVIRHLKVACLELNNYKGVSLLESYNEYWNKFLIFITIADAGFGYINKFCNIAMLLNQFKEHFFLNLLYPTRSTVLELINNERNLGITYNSLLISSVLKSYIFMGMANSDALNYEEYLVVYTLKSFDLPEINIYVDFFERKYLEEITVFYCQKSTEYLQNNSLLQYFIYINKIIKDEQDRCLRYMSPQTSNKL